jgi:O-6-methylguanine DNA methyltransferase
MQSPPGLLSSVELATGLADGFGVYDSPVGRVMVAFNPAGVSAVDLEDEGYEDRFRSRFGREIRRARPPAGWDVMIGKAIERGTPGQLPIDLGSVSWFQRQVLETTATIPRGEVRPYSWLAIQVGRPGAARAVGTTMARNPLPLIIPCHRVVRSDGRIGVYSLGGTDNKWLLLREEGANPEALEDLAARGIRVVGSDTTGIYCHPTCRNARRISDRHRRLFHSATEAAEAGYRPCHVCRP